MEAILVSTLTREERDELRRKAENHNKLLTDIEHEGAFGKKEIPEHCPPYRTNSGCRFGW